MSVGPPLGVVRPGRSRTHPTSTDLRKKAFDSGTSSVPPHNVPRPGTNSTLDFFRRAAVSMTTGTGTSRAHNTGVLWTTFARPGITTDAVAMYCDIVPTLVDLAGGTISDRIDAVSFSGVLLNGDASTSRKHALMFGQRHLTQRSIRKKDFKLIWTPDTTTAYHQKNIMGPESKKRFHDAWLEKAKTGSCGEGQSRSHYSSPGIPALRHERGSIRDQQLGVCPDTLSMHARDVL